MNGCDGVYNKIVEINLKLEQRNFSSLLLLSLNDYFTAIFAVSKNAEKSQSIVHSRQTCIKVEYFSISHTA